MNARLQQYRLLWRAAVTHANPRLSAITRWGVPFLLAIIGVAVAFSSGPRAALVFAWCSLCATVLLTWTWRFIPGAVKLASPANAKLVPGMRQRLVELACIVWFASIAGIAAAPYAEPRALGAALFMVVLGTVGSALGMAGHKAGGAVIMTACLGSLFADEIPEPVYALLSTPSMLVLALLLYAGVVFIAAREIFPEAGERHWAMIARRMRLTSAPGKSDPFLDKVAGVYTKGWYAAALRRDSARRDARALVLHAFGPTHHLGELVIGVGFLCCVLVAIGVFATWRMDQQVVGGIGWALACTVLIVPLVTILRLSQQSGAFPVEQSLVRLAPAMPGTAASFNRHLGRALLLNALKAWAIGSAATLALCAIGGASGATLLNVGCGCCLLLPLVAAPLRDHARRAPLAAVVTVLLLLVSATMDVALGFAARHAGLPVLPMAAVLSIATAFIAITRGLRAMAASPCAFPAGRID